MRDMVANYFEAHHIRVALAAGRSRGLDVGVAGHPWLGTAEGDRSRCLMSVTQPLLCNRPIDAASLLEALRYAKPIDVLICSMARTGLDGEEIRGFAFHGRFAMHSSSSA
jgi:hypothetical protein